eukprot:COSAG05_NODE_8167_length_729_cov_57.657143_1_plen_53_part_10
MRAAEAEGRSRHDNISSQAICDLCIVQSTIAYLRRTSKAQSSLAQRGAVCRYQ